MSKISDIEEIFKGMFLINFKIMDQYQWKDPGLMENI